MFNIKKGNSYSQTPLQTYKIRHCLSGASNLCSNQSSSQSNAHWALRPTNVGHAFSFSWLSGPMGSDLPQLGPALAEYSGVGGGRGMKG